MGGIRENSMGFSQAEQAAFSVAMESMAVQIPELVERFLGGTKVSELALDMKLQAEGLQGTFPIKPTFWAIAFTDVLGKLETGSEESLAKIVTQAGERGIMPGGESIRSSIRIQALSCILQIVDEKK